MKKCTFCNSEVIKSKETCLFCKGVGCFLCDNTGAVTLIRCTNSNCEPPDHNLEPWDENE